jgi:prepilin-type N-terminal cleavage/methylation domain-containing protein
MFTAIHSKKHGFTLLELLFALGIIGIITVFAISISYSTKNIARTNDTKKKMLKIASSAEEYYRGHDDLPDPAGTGNEVPVESDVLNLEQHMRLDGWGRYFHYNRVLHSVKTTKTDITGITVDGKEVAGVIVSGGPDQTIDEGNLSSPYITTGDDIVLAVNVTELALESAHNDLQVLHGKAQAFDAVFQGLDNNGNGAIDEDVCIGVTPLLVCPPLGPFSNDPNCGSATLDNIAGYGCFPKPSSAAEFIADLYSLADSYIIDPWLNDYYWGDTSYGSGDLRYHKFFSAGPDGIAGNSDDVVP